MSWHANLSVEIASMFADFSVREDEVQAVLEMRFAQRGDEVREYYRDWRRRRDTPERRMLAVLRTAEWRRKNPERARQLSNESSRRERIRAKTDPDVRARLRARGNRQKKRAWERDPEKMRAVWRRMARASRDRKRAALGLPPSNYTRSKP